MSSNEEFNRKMLGLFYAQSAQAGKALPHAPYWDEHKKQREVELQSNSQSNLQSNVQSKVQSGDHLKSAKQKITVEHS